MKLIARCQEVLKSKKGDMVSWIIIAVVVAIISLGTLTAVKDSIKDAQVETTDTIDEAASFTY